MAGCSGEKAAPAKAEDRPSMRPSAVMRILSDYEIDHHIVTHCDTDVLEYVGEGEWHCAQLGYDEDTKRVYFVDPERY